LHHDTEESRILSLSHYFKNKSNKNGHARLCKECYLIGVYGDKRKKRKDITIPNFDSSVYKWCNLCESVKVHKEFYHDKFKKDGLNANCKACKKTQKINYINKIKYIKPIENIEEKNIDTFQEINEKFDKNVFDEKYIHKYTIYDLHKICENKNLKFNRKMAKNDLINTIKENNTIDELEKFTKKELMQMATNMNIKMFHRYTKKEIIDLIKNFKI
jgi:hypothetical protein